MNVPAPASTSSSASLPAGSLPLAVLSGYLIAAFGVWLGLWATEWSAIDGEMWQAPSTEHWLGTNRLGQDIHSRAIAATATAFEIGLTVALGSTLLGIVIGAMAGFFAHRWIDEVMLWLTGTMDAIPFYLFVAAMAFVLRDHPWAIQLAMIVTFWTITARIVRAETQRIRGLPFIEAARASGLPQWRIITRHVFPHLSHIALVQATLVFVAAVKAEVILSFLGIGVHDKISWGIMIAEGGQDILAGHYMNFVTASIALFGLIMSINLLADGMQDWLDPRTRQVQRQVQQQAHAHRNA